MSSPPYLHHLSTSPSQPLSSASFQMYLLYLYETYGRTEYYRYVMYPVAFSYIPLLIHPAVSALARGVRRGYDDVEGGEKTTFETDFSRGLRTEWGRDKLHQEQFATWKWR